MAITFVAFLYVTTNISKYYTESFLYTQLSAQVCAYVSVTGVIQEQQCVNQLVFIQ